MWRLTPFSPSFFVVPSIHWNPNDQVSYVIRMNYQVCLVYNARQILHRNTEAACPNNFSDSNTNYWNPRHFDNLK